MKLVYVADDGTQFNSERECLDYESSPLIFYIENTINEYNNKITRYCLSLEEAKKQLRYCSDWYCDRGTGSIYEVRCNTKSKPRLVYQVTQEDLSKNRG